MISIARSLSSAFLKRRNLSPYMFCVQRNFILQEHRIEVAPYLMNRTIPAVETLKKLTQVDAERLEYIKTEHQIFFASGNMVPSKLTDAELVELLCCKSHSGRLKYYEFRFKVEKMRESRTLKKRQQTEEPISVDLMQKNVIFGLIRDKPMRMHADDWLAAEIRNEDSSQMLVFDCSHEQEMRLVDQKNLAKQFAMVLAHNRISKPFPFHIVFTSVVPGTNQYHFIQEAINYKEGNTGLFTLDNGLFTVKKEHFQDSNFGGRRIVYLSPNAHRAFEPGEFDHNAAYVVGGIVDKAIRRPVTHAHARRSGLECLRLPIERYLDWRSGNKTLTLVAIHAILATAKRTNGDWKTALEENIPKRFLRDSDRVECQINSILRSI